MRSDSGVTCGGPACRYNAIVNTGIKIVERVPIPKELVPADAHVEINAKVFAGSVAHGMVNWCCE